MNTLGEQVPNAAYSDGRVFVTLPNGVDFSFSIVGNRRLEGASLEQVNNIEIDATGLHWPDIDEDLSFDGLLRGDYGQFVRHRQR